MITDLSSDATGPFLQVLLLLVEDEPVMQMRLCAILTGLGYEETAITSAASIAEARQALVSQPFSMAFVDIGLLDGSGTDLIREIHEQDLTLPILVISAWSTEKIIFEAIQAGATGYLLKERDDVEITLSIRSFLRGRAPIDPFIARRILAVAFTASTREDAPVSTVRSILTAREVEILGLVAKGLTNREISEILGLSRTTVESHIKNIYKKLAVGTRTEAVFEARAHGLLS